MAGHTSRESGAPLDRIVDSYLATKEWGPALFGFRDLDETQISYFRQFLTLARRLGVKVIVYVPPLYPRAVAFYERETNLPALEDEAARAPARLAGRRPHRRRPRLHPRRVLRRERLRVPRSRPPHGGGLPPHARPHAAAAARAGRSVLFPSHLFLFGFLPVVVAVYWLLSPGARRWWLLAASAVFYGWADWRFLALLGGMTALSFVATKGLMGRDSLRARRLGLALAFGNLIVLGVFKYYDLFATTLNDLVARIGLGPMASVLHLALPLGISFYTFNLLGYGMDVYRRRAAPAPSFPDLLRYASFFPTVTSGPLMRYGDFSAQMEADRRPEAVGFELGLFNLGLGLAKKLVIADWIGAGHRSALGGPRGARGLGGLAGGRRLPLPPLLRFLGLLRHGGGGGPFPRDPGPRQLSRSLHRAQHHRVLAEMAHHAVDLVPGLPVPSPEPVPPATHVGAATRTGRGLLSLLLTMSLIGFWHGPSWTYLVWGAYQGLLLAIHAQARSRRKPWPTWAGRALTTLAVLLGWVLFRSGSLGMAASVYASMFGMKGWGPPLTSIPGVDAGFLLLLAGLLVLTNLPWDMPDLRPRRELGYAMGLAALLVIGLLFVGQPTTFLYFQF